jgi:riboflavin transporter FmnP
MTTTGKHSFLTVGNMTRIAILAAAACILDLLQIPIVAFYKLDLGNVPVLLGTFAMGPIPGIIILALKCLIGLLHSSSMGIGKLADFLMSLALIVPAGLIYYRNKTRKDAIIGMLIGTLCMTVAGVLINKWILLPFYMTAFHMDMNGILAYAGVNGVDSEWRLLLLVTGPFNLLKGVLLCLVTALIYKPLSPLLHHSRS